MTETERYQPEVLVAFLDGELAPAEAEAIAQARAQDVALAARLEQLEAGARFIRPVFDSVLQAAPDERLKGMLAAAMAQDTATRNRAAPRRRMSWLEWAGSRLAPSQAGWPRLAALGLVLFVLGGVAGGWLGNLSGTPSDQPEGWRQAVAEYWLLTTPATLSIQPPPELAAQQLSRAGEALALDLSAATAPPPNLSFRGAQLYDFQGRALTQIAYLDPEHGPIAYCIINAPGKAPAGLADETMDGFNIVHWADNGHARMLIGRAPPETLRAYATQFVARAG